METNLLFIHLVAGAAATAAPHTLEAKPFTISFQKAVACAANAASQSSFDRDRLDRIPQETLEHCATEQESAVQDMTKAIPGSDLNMARENVAAKMRMAAQERVVNRLEEGESLRGFNDDGFGLEKAGARYISCTRLAINHRLEGGYLGQDWTVEIGGLPEDQLEGYFVQIGRSSCPASFQSYSTTLDNALNGADRRTKSAVAANWNMQKVERIAIAPYIRMALDLRQEKP